MQTEASDRIGGHGYAPAASRKPLISAAVGPRPRQTTRPSMRRPGERQTLRATRAAGSLMRRTSVASVRPSAASAS